MASTACSVYGWLPPDLPCSLSARIGFLAWYPGCSASLPGPGGLQALRQPGAAICGWLPPGLSAHIGNPAWHPGCSIFTRSGWSFGRRIDSLLHFMDSSFQVFHATSLLVSAAQLIARLLNRAATFEWPSGVTSTAY